MDLAKSFIFQQEGDGGRCWPLGRMAGETNPKGGRSVCELVEQQITPEVIKKLVLCTLNKLQRRRWGGLQYFIGAGHQPDDLPLPEGQTAQDLVADSLRDVLDGTRGWDPVLKPDLVAHLESIVDSKISNLVRSEANRVWNRETSAGSEPGSYRKSNPPFDERIDPRVLAPREALEEKLTKQDLERLIGEVYNAVADDNLLKQMVECAEMGYTTPRECAELMDVDVSVIYNARKKLDRRLKGIRLKFQAPQFGGARERVGRGN